MMAACDFQPRGNWWICLTCGIVVPKRGDKPPHATCAGQWIMPRTEAKRSTGKRRRDSNPAGVILRRYDALIATKGTAGQLPREEVERRTAICVANGCGKFTGQGCAERTGSGCKAGQRWFERLMLGCPRFAEHK